MKRTTMALLSATTLTLTMALPKVGTAAKPITSNQMVPFDLVLEGDTESHAIHGTST